MAKAQQVDDILKMWSLTQLPPYPLLWECPKRFALNNHKLKDFWHFAKKNPTFHKLIAPIKDTSFKVMEQQST